MEHLKLIFINCSFICLRWCISGDLTGEDERNKSDEWKQLKTLEIFWYLKICLIILFIIKVKEKKGERLVSMANHTKTGQGEKKECQSLVVSK